MKLNAILMALSTFFLRPLRSSCGRSKNAFSIFTASAGTRHRAEHASRTRPKSTKFCKNDENWYDVHGYERNFVDFWPEEDISSTRAEFCWVLESKDVIALLISLIAVNCSFVADSTSFTISSTFWNVPSISSRFEKFPSTLSTPLFTFSIDAVIRDLISWTASEALCARSLTSIATTAKPFPWSPALAASIAAFILS